MVACGILARMTPDLESRVDKDELLVARARRGDRDAFDQLVVAHLPVVWRVVYRIVRHPDDAQDVAQEVFLTAWQSLAAFRGDARFSTWLHQIAVSRALNHVERAAEKLRRRSRSIDMPSGSSSGEASADLDGGPAWEAERDRRSPLAALEAAELRRRIAKCLEEMPGAWRAVLALRDGEGLSYEDIAAAARTALGTVRSRLARARLALRACLEAQGVHP